MGQIERGGLDHPLGIGITSREPQPVPHHLHRSLGYVHAVELRPAGDELTAQGPVAEADLQRPRPREGLSVEVGQQVGVLVEIGGVEAGEALGRRVGDPQLARQRRATQLVPEPGVSVVEGGL